MSGPNGAPTPGRPALVRARLLDMLSDRWRLPVVAVVAGAGFGKTTLLAQAAAENLLDPRGTDHWYSCRSDDAVASTFGVHLANAVGLERDASDEVTPEDIANALSGRAPRHECLLLDDAHLLGDGAAPALLSRLIELLPSNGHLVIASRPPSSVPLSRLQAVGRARVLVESELAFDESESRAFAAMRVVSAPLVAEAAGWPALAELAASADRNAGMEFLWDELLAVMPVSQRARLAVLSALGRADDRLLSAALGESVPVSVRDVVRNVPLASVTPDGWAVVHDLWAEPLRAALDPHDRQAALERAGHLARADQRLVDAFRLFVETMRWDLARQVVREACANSHPLVPLDVLGGWHAQLLAGCGPCTEVTLLRGVIVKQTAPEEAVICLRRAAGAFGDAGLRDEEASCLFHLGHMFWWGNRNDELAALIARVSELAAAGSWLATSMLELAHVLMAEVDDPDPLGATVDVGGTQHPLHPEIVPLRCWLLARNQLYAGEVRRALLTAEASVTSATPTMRAVSEFLVLQCRWASGLPGSRAAVFEQLDATLTAVRREGWLHFTVADLAQAAMWCALDSRRDRAQALLAEAASIPQLASVWSDAVVGLARAVLAAAEGDDDAAARLLIDELTARPLADPSADLAHRPWLCVSYVLAPSTRAHWDAVGLLGAHTIALQCGRALVAAHEGRHLDSVTAVRSVSHEHDELIRSFVPPPWLGTLAALFGASGDQRTATALLTDSAGPARAELLALARGRSRPMADAATALLRTAAAMPSRSVSIDVLGTLRLRFDGVEEWPAELNRRVVRDLLLVLVELGPITRERVRSLLWPDDDEGAAAYLRRTLSYLNRALDPHRVDGDDTYFVIERGEQLHLRRGPHLVVDVDDFDDALRAAAQAEAQGALSVAVEQLLRAIDRYRGDYATDAGLAEWVLPARERHRVRFVAACIRAGSLLVARGDAEQGAELATRAIRTEHWSEPARILLAEAHVLRGDLAAARRTADECDEMLAGLGVERRSPELTMLRRRLGLD